MTQTISERIKDFEIGLELMKLNLERLKIEFSLETERKQEIYDSILNNTQLLLEIEHENSIENEY